MKLGILTLLIALSISAIAAYFSVVGLVALFAAAAIPVAIMGGILEVGKIVATAWLHQNWKSAPRLLKSFLTSAVVVLMLITSIGIYGFLSKGHLEQQAPVAGMASQIARNNLTIETTEAQIARLREETVGATVVDDTARQQAIEAQRQQVQARIDEVQLRLTPIDTRIQAQRDIIRRLEDRIAGLDATIKAYNDVGSVTKGREALADQQDERTSINASIDEATAKIVEIENEKFAINEQIASLRSEMANVTVPVTVQDNSQRTQINNQIKQLEAEISALEDTNLEINLQMTEVSAKLGPILYVADLFNITDPEKAVQAIIVLIMFAFDPLAISLIIAAQWSFEQRRGQRKLADPTLINKQEEQIHGLEVSLETAKRRNALAEKAAETAALKLNQQIQQHHNEIQELQKKNDLLQTAMANTPKADTTSLAKLKVNEQLIGELREKITNAQKIIEQKDAALQSFLGDEDFQFVISKLRDDKNLTNGLKTILVQAESTDSTVDLNEGVAVSSQGARTVIKQISNPDEATRISWLNSGKDKP